MSRSDPYASYGHPPAKSAAGTFFKCLTVVAVTGTLCVTGLVMAGMGIANSRVEHFVRFAGGALEDLPAALKEAAPILADATRDRRAPEYVASVDVEARVVATAEAEDRCGHYRRGSRAVVEIKNTGDKVISVLALRLVTTDESGQPIADQTVYGATPLAVDGEWRGPLFPNSTRRISVWCSGGEGEVQTEIAELRVWEPAA